ncbi:amidohydrolase family protein [Pseudarthrobacter raffinosi]|uniref:amidohydrolase family protein n=1 Tax=Pseudarthrobacter raffinosi TaxID=2953651 RepID=UPI00208F014A|nr:amidohydrolase family protein [Pseudarthrobacter sp. MDT3-9]MCO4252129.1 amidohydrolase [Pseudarthrobacter sp. MDT3-9]
MKINTTKEGILVVNQSMSETPPKPKIDIHQHVLPPFWVDHLREHPSPHRLPEWSPEAAIASMDRQGISKAYLSLSVPGVLPWPEDERASAARRANEYTAHLIERWPDRFGNLATLPLPDVEAALTELNHAYDHLDVDGVILFTNYGDMFLGDPTFEPLWEELDRRSAVVLIHPDSTTLPGLEGIPASLVDFPFATTRAAVDLVFHGVIAQYPNVRWVLSHAGGFLPYAADRFATGGSMLPGAPDKETLMRQFRCFYLDTALSTSSLVLPSLTAFADPERILFGSDYPYAAGKSEEFTAALDNSALLSEEQHCAITWRNADNMLSSSSINQ